MVLLTMFEVNPSDANADVDPSNAIFNEIDQYKNVNLGNSPIRRDSVGNILTEINEDLGSMRDSDER